MGKRTTPPRAPRILHVLAACRRAHVTAHAAIVAFAAMKIDVFAVVVRRPASAASHSRSRHLANSKQSLAANCQD